MTSANNGARKPYRMRDLTATLNLSRSTLIYYEDLGIVDPHRTGDGSHRQYDDRDVFRVMTAILLKNVGVAPHNLKSILDADPYADERFDEYDALLAARAEYVAAQRECLTRLRRARERLGQTIVQDVEAHYIRCDAGEEGYGEFRQDDTLDALGDNSPIGSFGAVGSDDLFAPDETVLWGRTVAVRHAHLVPGLSVEGMQVVGGGRCVVHYARCDSNNVRQSWSDLPWRRNVADALAEHGFELAGAAFAPYCITSEDSLIAPICFPVREAGGPRPVRLREKVRRALGR